MYYTDDKNGDLAFILATQMDEYLYTGSLERMQRIEHFLKDTFQVCSLSRLHLSLMECAISRHEDGSVTLSQSAKLAELIRKTLRDAVGDNKFQLATEGQATLHRNVIGKILFVGRMTAPRDGPSCSCTLTWA